MEIDKIKSIIEAILFAAGRQVSIKELMISLEIPREELENIIVSMQEDYKIQNRGRIDHSLILADRNKSTT